MPRRRNSPPPFEIMSALPAPSAKVHAPSIDRIDRTAGWWERARYPVVLRVPRGYVALAGLFMVGLLVLAYMVGQSRGRAEGIAQARAEYELRFENAPVGVVPIQTVDRTSGTPAGANSGDSRVDPREEGLNYFVLAHDDEQGARRLLQFLASRGVDAAAFETSRGLYKVVALRGFPGKERSSPAIQEYERKLQRLGVEWGNMPGGRSFTNQGMYPERYKGGEVGKILRPAAQ